MSGTSTAPTAGPTPRRLDAVVVAAVVGLVWARAGAAVGLRTDLGGHLAFAERTSLTGEAFGPYYLFEQATILVRALLPFGAIDAALPLRISRQATWDIAGVLVHAGAAALTAVVLLRGFTRILPPVVVAGRGPRLVVAATAIALMVVAPLTFLTWPDHHLVIGYISTTTYENPTTTVARPLALLLFWYLADRVRQVPEAPRRLAPLVGLSILALHAKPSFSLTLLPALGLTWLWCRFRRRPFDLRLAGLGFAVPTVAYLLLQGALFLDTGGIELAPMRTVGDLLEGIGQPRGLALPLLVASAALPVTVAVALRAEARRSSALHLAWLCFGIGSAMFYLLAISGKVDYGDLIGGAELALSVLLAESMRLVLRRWSRLAPAQRRRDRRTLVIAGVLGLHLVCGALLWYREVTVPAAWW